MASRRRLPWHGGSEITSFRYSYEGAVNNHQSYTARDKMKDNKTCVLFGFCGQGSFDTTVTVDLGALFTLTKNCTKASCTPWCWHPGKSPAYFLHEIIHAVHSTRPQYHTISYDIIRYHTLSYTIIHYHTPSCTIIHHHTPSSIIIQYHTISYTIIQYHTVVRGLLG